MSKSVLTVNKRLFAVLYLTKEGMTFQHKNNYTRLIYSGQLRWPSGLKRRSAASRLLGLWVRIPPKGKDFPSCECCVLPDRGLCFGLITRPEYTYQVCVCVCVCVCVSLSVIRHNNRHLHLLGVGVDIKTKKARMHKERKKNFIFQNMSADNFCR